MMDYFYIYYFICSRVDERRYFVITLKVLNRRVEDDGRDIGVSLQIIGNCRCDEGG